MNILISELHKLPYYDGAELAGRVFPLLPFLDRNSHWHNWIAPNGKLQPFKSFPAEGPYFSTTPLRAEDLSLSFLDFAYKQILFPQTEFLIGGLVSDLHNLGACLTKIDVLFNYSEGRKLDSARLAGTELKYLFLLCRSIFDLIQEVISVLWKKVVFSGTKTKNLPRTFRKMVLHARSPMNTTQIARQHGVPASLASYYHQQAEFFLWLRDYRDQILHSGKGFDLVFVTQSGFGVPTDRFPFDSMPIWNDSNTKSNNIGSFVSVAHHLVRKVLRALDDLADVLPQVVQFPPDLAPRVRVFLTGDHVPQLVALLQERLHPWQSATQKKP